MSIGMNDALLAHSLPHVLPVAHTVRSIVAVRGCRITLKIVVRVRLLRVFAPILFGDDLPASTRHR